MAEVAATTSRGRLRQMLCANEMLNDRVIGDDVLDTPKQGQTIPLPALQRRQEVVEPEPLEISENRSALFDTVQHLGGFRPAPAFLYAAAKRKWAEVKFGSSSTARSRWWIDAMGSTANSSDPAMNS